MKYKVLLQIGIILFLFVQASFADTGLPPITQFRIEATASQFNLMWQYDPPSQVTQLEFRIQRRSETDPPNQFLSLHSLSGASRKSVDSPANGASLGYYYRIRAVGILDGKQVVSPWKWATPAPEIFALEPPLMPGGIERDFTAQRTSSGTVVTLRWRDNSQFEHGYIVEKVEGDGPSQQVAAVQSSNLKNGQELSWTGPLSEMRPSEFQVRAFRRLGDGSQRTSTPLKIGPIFAQLKAMPWSYGYGSETSGGRGGDVAIVTELADYAENEAPIEGTLRRALETKRADVPRTIVFRRGGTIQLKRSLVLSNFRDLTIAGQTAPAPGITIALETGKNIPGHAIQVYGSENLIFRNLRIIRGNSAAGTYRPRVPPNGPDGYLGKAYELNFAYCAYQLSNIRTRAHLDQFIEVCRGFMPIEDYCRFFNGNNLVVSQSLVRAKYARFCGERTAKSSGQRLVHFDFDPDLRQVNGAAISLNATRRVVLDHMQLTAGTDETLVIWNTLDSAQSTEYFSVQNSMINDALSEPRAVYLYYGLDRRLCPQTVPASDYDARNYRIIRYDDSGNRERGATVDLKCVTYNQFYPNGHPLGTVIGSQKKGELSSVTQNVSVFRNLYVNNRHRNPKMAADRMEVVQNYVTNWNSRAAEVYRGANLDLIENVFEPRRYGSFANPVLIFDFGAFGNNRIYLKDNLYDSVIPSLRPNNVNVAQYEEYKESIRTDQVNLFRKPNGSLVECASSSSSECVEMRVFDSHPTQNPSARIPSMGDEGFANALAYFQERHLDRVGNSFVLDCLGTPQTQGVRGDFERSVIEQVKDRRRWFDHVRSPARNLEDLAARYGLPPSVFFPPSTTTSCGDSDRDGLPNHWESRHGGNTRQLSASGDEDGDGYTNLEEFLNCTSPTRSDLGRRRSGCL